VAETAGDIGGRRGDGDGDLGEDSHVAPGFSPASLTTMPTMNELTDLETKAASAAPFTRADADRIMACADLISIGMVGEAARKARHGDRVTWGRVCVLSAEPWPASCGDAGEVRIAGRPASVDEARARVCRARPLAGATPLTGFSAADLLDLAGGDHLALADLAKALAADGLASVAELPLDRLGDTENVVEVVRALRHGGLGVWRATVERAAPADRLDLIERAVVVQRETAALKVLAPLPRRDPRDTPSTGYDDVRTIAVARVMCPAAIAIQVDWPLYGPKLAQVALAYGADDVDGVAAIEDPTLGTRRSPGQDVERQIRAAFATPVERNGGFEPRP
jgi:aminodeoxyfutalosine synthase